MTKEQAKEIFEAGINYGAEKFGSSAGHFGLRLTSPDFEEWWEKYADQFRQPEQPARSGGSEWLTCRHCGDTAMRHLDQHTSEGWWKCNGCGLEGHYQAFDRPTGSLQLEDLVKELGETLEQSSLLICLGAGMAQDDWTVNAHLQRVKEARELYRHYKASCGNNP